MSIVLSSRDLLQIAVEIEKSGIAFYSTLAKKAAAGEVKTLYLQLVEQEIKHREFFQGMIKSAGYQEPPEIYTEEYWRYVRALISNRVFPTDEAARDRAASLEDDVEALTLAIDLEVNAILFYTEMKNVIRKEDINTLDRIMEEEKRQIRQLTELKLDIVEGHVG